MENNTNTTNTKEKVTAEDFARFTARQAHDTNTTTKEKVTAEDFARYIASQAHDTDKDWWKK